VVIRFAKVLLLLWVPVETATRQGVEGALSTTVDADATG
jgi:hypothetical protein